eukprot:4973888-Pleurochrysis_carterae.AAC.2
MLGRRAPRGQKTIGPLAYSAMHVHSRDCAYANDSRLRAAVRNTIRKACNAYPFPVIKSDISEPTTVVCARAGLFGLAGSGIGRGTPET